MDFDEAYACDAIVIGCGAAGIAAARELNSSGLQRVVVLEARHRVGGRAYTSDELGCGVPLDHGAQWIHGLSDKHPMVQLANSAGVTVAPMAGSRTLKRHSDGQLVDNNDASVADRAFSKLRNCIRRYSQEHNSIDLPWSEVVMKNASANTLQEALTKLLGDTDKGMELRRSLLHGRIYASVENYEGASVDTWSALHSDEGSCLGGGNGDVFGGYGALIAKHACDLDVKFGRQVREIIYPDVEDEQVIVHCDIRMDGECRQEKYVAPLCIVTLPLGVLRHGSVNFNPPLPLKKQTAIARLGIALMDKVELLWERRWWPAGVGSLTIASLESTPTYHPWPWFLEPPEARNHPLGWAVLVCFVTGRFAEEIESMDDESVVANCVHALSRAYSCEVPQPKDACVSRWGQDPYSRGSWTYFATGSSIQDINALAEPVGRNGCVVFAGEHTCDGSSLGLDIGTLHGAWLSGIRATRNLLRSRTRQFHPPSRTKNTLPGRTWRTNYRHRADTVIPSIEGYTVGAEVIVTSEAMDIKEEFEVDPDESPNIFAAQQYCNKRGAISGQSQWGWLKIAFQDGSQSRWFTPFCLWIVESNSEDCWRTDYRHRSDLVIPHLEGYVNGAKVIVTSEPSEISDELEVDPEESTNIPITQQCCGKRGTIASRSKWGWLKVDFDDASQARWFTPFCLWILKP